LRARNKMLRAALSLLVGGCVLVLAVDDHNTPAMEVEHMITTLTTKLDKRKYGEGSFALGIKTCQFYHKTRLKAVLDNWAYQVPHKVIGTDVPIENKSISSDVVVSRDIRNTAYVPPWREDFEGDANEIDPFKLPRLTAKLALILQTLWSRFKDKVEWFMVVDDDTFVRVNPMRAYLSHIDARNPHMIGGVVPSDKFATEVDHKRYGRSAHCGGGTGFIFSKATMRSLVPQIGQCLRAHHTTLYWYWDEVEFGRCVYALLGLNCSSPEGLWGLHRFLRSSKQLDFKAHDIQNIDSNSDLTRGAVAIGSNGPEIPHLESDLTDMFRPLENFFWGAKRFMGGLNDAQDWTKYELFMHSMVAGNWSLAGVLTLHTVLPEYQQLLAKKFTISVDNLWVNRFENGDPDA